MSNDDVPDFKSDVPTGSALALDDVKDRRAWLARLAGDLPPNECRFLCVTCGWDKTLQFDKDEMAALDDDVKNYGGPCGKCSRMTLQPYDAIAQGSFKSIHEQSRENKKKDYGEAADVFIEKVKDQVGSIMTGGMTPPPGPAHETGVPGQRSDLPDASTVDASDLPPRKG